MRWIGIGGRGLNLDDLAAPPRAGGGGDTATAAMRSTVDASEWERAFSALSVRDASEPLGAEDLEALGEAA
jgi:TRAP-type mannitol/chloroaromatic compound transport system substrate-binding protein